MITYKTDASTFSPTTDVTDCIEDAVALARKLLPEIPEEIVVEFEDRADDSGVGVSGFPKANGVTVLAWDQHFPDKPAQIVSLRTELLHHAYHWCQGYTHGLPTRVPDTALDVAIYEGAASAFARDYSGTDPLWSNYAPLSEETLRRWRDALAEIPVTVYATRPEVWRRWAGLHPDPGESWKAHRVGTWMVDQYVARSGQSVLGVRHLDAAEIISSVWPDKNE